MRSNAKSWRLGALTLATYAVFGALVAGVGVAAPWILDAPPIWHSISMLGSWDMLMASAAFYDVTFVALGVATLLFPAFLAWRRGKGISAPVGWVVAYSLAMFASHIALAVLAYLAERRENFPFPGGTLVVGEGAFGSVMMGSLFTVVPLILFVVAWVAGSRHETPGSCAACGYSRAGLAADARCPECGAG